jgi:Leucine-rich repeat (LRR) protein
MRFVFLILFLVLNINLFAGVAEKDSLALVAFFDSTNGQNWSTPWDLEQPVSSWSGITINQDRVTRISITSNTLSGNLPEQMTDLDSLDYLTIRLNTELTKFPYFLASLKNLYQLNLANNGIDTLTSEIGNFKHLQYLYLNSNKIIGELPAELGQLTTLTHFNISQNDFSGIIPVEILNLTNLESFRAGGNLFTSMPDFSQLPLLNDLWIENNLFSGPLPGWVSDMTQMVSLNLGGNSFDGEFPASFANMQLLRWFYMSSNNFSGSIPAEIGSMKNVIFLELYNNNFTGSIPAEIGNMESLQYLRLNNNQLEGEIPEHIFSAKDLKQIELQNNNLNGNIPDSLSTCINVTHIKLQQNQLTGKVPTLKNLENLQEIWLSENNLEGELDWLGKKNKSIIRFYINGNNFEGAIPDIMAKIPTLGWMDISDNNFDCLPSFKYHPFLTTLGLDFNKFTFEDILPQLGGNISNISYGTQDTVGLAKTFSVPENSTLTLNMKVGGKGNIYTWYRDETFLTDEDTSGMLQINVTEENLGSYSCYVLNDSAPFLGLFTAPVTVEFGSSDPDSLALVELYHATNGSNWNNNNGWLSAAAIETWYGVQKDRDYYTIDLSANNLNGTIPESICSLMNATILILNGNSIAGKIPAELGRLNNLSDLNLASNKLGGRVPQELALIAALKNLDISDNNLKDLPDFSALNKTFDTMSVDDNALTFEDIEGNINAVSTFSYAPQDSIGDGDDISVEQGAPFSFEVCVAGSANKYQWYLDEVQITGATDSIYSVDETTADDAGAYICKISSELVPDLTITSRPFNVTVEVIDAITDGQKGIPVAYALRQNYPNPFNPSTRISYQLPQSTKVQLKVYDIMGREVKTLINGYQTAGYYSIDFDAGSLSSGIYFYDIKAGRFSKTLKMILMK